ncbi:MAG: serine beta-lactamase-like protein LACTB [Flavobacterium sp.]|jgi:serine beta-lactamase-like protein LACTB
MKIAIRLLGIVVLLVVVGAIIVVVTVLSMGENKPTGAPPADSFLADDQYKAAAKQALARLEDLRAERDWPSMSMAVGRNGRLVWAGAVGWADFLSAENATPDHRYRVGSVAKPLTTAALGQLIDEGKLDLNDSLYKYLPRFPTKSATFSLRQLASHTAGVRHYADGIAGMSENFHETQYETVSDGLVLFQEDPLLFPPGTSFNYSSFGYNLLSAAMEVADGRDYLTLMQERVFTPANMDDTQAEHTPSPVPLKMLAKPYFAYEDNIMRAPYVNNSYKWAGGGFISTPKDLVNFGLLLLDGGLVSKATLAEMWVPVLLNNGEPNPGGYGLGFRFGHHEGDRFISHGGASVGGASYLVIFPELGLVAAFATNVSSLSGSPGERKQVRALATLFAE